MPNVLRPNELEVKHPHVPGNLDTPSFTQLQEPGRISVISKGGMFKQERFVEAILSGPLGHALWEAIANKYCTPIETEDQYVEASDRQYRCDLAAVIPEFAQMVAAIGLEIESECTARRAEVQQASQGNGATDARPQHRTAIAGSN